MIPTAVGVNPLLTISALAERIVALIDQDAQLDLTMRPFDRTTYTEPILRAAVRHPEFYRLDASLWPREELWWTDVGREQYKKDPEKARQLLKEAGYRGEPVRYLLPQDMTADYRSSFVIKQQLEEVGVVIDLQVVNWAALVQRQNNPDR
jgi:ABC-type transport system substrate-binding protein